MKKQRGFTLLELLFTLAVTAIIASTFLKSLSSTFSVWNKGEGRIQAAQGAQKSIPELDQRLKGAKQITAVSLMESTTGFITYLDRSDTAFSIYLNTESNRAALGQNTFPNNMLMVRYGTHDPEVLLDEVSEFTLVTYTDFSGAVGSTSLYRHRIASPNNVANPVSFDDITSIKATIKRSNGDVPYVISTLATLERDRIEEPGQLTIGSQFDGASHFLFGQKETSPAWTVTNAFIRPELLVIDDDSLIIETPTATVKIRYTSQYFTDIQTAIDAALEGQDVLVSAGTYLGDIELKAGVRLLGGFESTDWTRDIHTHETIIQILPGVDRYAVQMAANSVLDGFIIDGQDLALESVRVEGVTGVEIKDVDIRSVETGILFQDASGLIRNIAVTANSRTILANNVGRLTILRSYLKALGLSNDSNVLLRDASEVIVANCIIEGGRDGIDVVRNTLTPSLVVHNTVFKNYDVGINNFGSNMVVANGVFHSGVTPILVSNHGNLDIQFNIFADNTDSSGVVGEQDGPGVTVANNQILSPTEWSDGTPFVTNLTDYTLIVSSPFIDAGNPATSFNDTVYSFVAETPQIGSSTDGSLTPKPSSGTSRGDIGLLGGPFAGRVGLGQRHELLTSHVPLGIIEDRVLSGDHVHFDEGTHSFSRVEFPKDVLVTGESEDTMLSNGGGAATLTLRGQSEVADMVIDGNNNIGVLTLKNGVSRLSGLLLREASVGAYIFRGSSTQLHNLYYDNVEGVKHEAQIGDDTTSRISHGIFSDNTVGMRNIFGQVFSTQNDFFQTTSEKIGAVTASNDKTFDPIFRDEPGDVFYLLASSNARLANGQVDRDLGPYPYYEVTASATSPYIVSHIDRRYQRITLTYSGDPDDPTAVQFGEISATVRSFTTELVLTPSVLVTSGDELTQTWEFPSTTLSRKFQVTLNLASYRYGKTPQVDGLRLVWGEVDE